MSPLIKRIIVTGWVTLAIGVFVYFTGVKSNINPLLKLAIIFGGCGTLFVMVKGYLFRM